MTMPYTRWQYRPPASPRMTSLLLRPRTIKPRGPARLRIIEGPPIAVCADCITTLEFGEDELRGTFTCIRCARRFDV